MKNNVFLYSRLIGNFCVLWRNTTNSYVIPQTASLWNFLVNTLLHYIPLLTLTDGITDRETHTLAARGLEELFSSCAVVSVFGSGGEIGFGSHTYVLRVPYSCGVVSVFLVLVGNSFWYVRSPYSCGVMLVFLVLAGNSFWCYGGCVFKKWLSVFLIFEKQLSSQYMFLVKSKLSIATYLFLVFYKSTSL